MRWATSTLLLALMLVVAAAFGAQAADLEARALKACTTSSQCSATQYCGSKKCRAKLADGVACSSDISCLNSLCQSKTGLCASANLKNGLKCTLSTQCTSGNCEKKLCAAKLVNGVACSKDANCLSSYCSVKTQKCARLPAPATSSSSSTTSASSSSSSTSSSSTSSSSTSTSSSSTTSSSSSSSSTSTSSSSSSSTSSTTATQPTTPAPPPPTPEPEPECSQSKACQAGFACQSSVCVHTGLLGEPCSSSGPACSAAYLRCNDRSVCVNVDAAGPEQPCFAEVGCLGDFRCLGSPATCTLTGGRFQRCTASGGCGDGLACANDDLCRPTTRCAGGCNYPAETCAPTSALPNAAYACQAAGQLAQPCTQEGTCAVDTLACSAATSKCVLKAVTPITPPEEQPPAATTCVPGCNTNAEICQGFGPMGRQSFLCLPAGLATQPCLDGARCQNDSLFCESATAMCKEKPPTTCIPACDAASQVCLNPADGVFTCAAAGADGQPCLASGACGAEGLSCLAGNVCGPTPPLDVGGSCAVDAQCKASLECLAATPGGAKSCTAVGTLNQPCSKSGACGASLTCGVAGKCIVASLLGESCAGDVECAQDARCTSVTVTVAGSPVEQKQCVAAGALRQPCLKTAGCGSASLACTAAQDLCLYKAPAVLDATCQQDVDCGPTLRCTGTAGAKTCSAAGTLDLPCLQNSTCSEPTTVCAQDKCVVPGKVGDACSEPAAPCNSTLACSATKPLEPAAAGSRRAVRYRSLNARLGDLETRTVSHEAVARSSLTPRDETPVPLTCVPAGLSGQPCFANGTCGIGQRCLIGVCTKYYARLNETCSLPLNETSKEPVISCDEGLRCKMNTTVVTDPVTRRGSFKNVTACQPAGAFRQLCLLPGYTCSGSMTCSGNSTGAICLLGLGDACSPGGCGKGLSCSTKNSTCVNSGGLEQPCLDGSLCNTGLRCSNSTGTPQCMTRPNSCTDLSQMDKTKLCPECDKLCQLEKDGETMACQFSAGKSYAFTPPLGINNISLSASSGGGGNSTIFQTTYVNASTIVNATAVNATGANATQTTQVRRAVMLPNEDAGGGGGGTPTQEQPVAPAPNPPTQQQPVAAELNATAPVANATVEAASNSTTLRINGTDFIASTTNVTLAGGVGATITGWFSFVPGRIYTINVGGLGNGSTGGFNGGGAGFTEPRGNSTASMLNVTDPTAANLTLATNATLTNFTGAPLMRSYSGGGGGRTEIVDSTNSSIVVCVGGGGGAGYNGTGGMAGFNATTGNLTSATGFGVAGNYTTKLGEDAEAIGMGAGGGGCPTGGSAATEGGWGGGGGLSVPQGRAKPNNGTDIPALPPPPTSFTFPNGTIMVLPTFAPAPPNPNAPAGALPPRAPTPAVQGQVVLRFACPAF